MLNLIETPEQRCRLHFHNWNQAKPRSEMEEPLDATS